MVDIATRLPLTAAQESVWFAHEIDSSGLRYNCAEYLEIDGPLDAAIFRAAWAVVREEADAVRVGSFHEDGALWQVVRPAADVDLLTRDFTDAADPEREAHRWMRADLARPVDLSSGPISTFALITVGPQRHVFFCRMHHIVTDAFSMNLLQQAVGEVYSAMAAGQHRPVSGLRPLSGLVAEDAAYRCSPRFAADRRYWTDRFADRPAVMRIAGHATGTRAGGSAPLRRVSLLTGAYLDRLAQVANAAGTTWQVVLLAATAGYVHRLTGRRDVIVGLPVSGRRSGASHRTPGMVTNTVALRVAVPPGTSLSRLIRRVSR